MSLPREMIVQEAVKDILPKAHADMESVFRGAVSDLQMLIYDKLGSFIQSSRIAEILTAYRDLFGDRSIVGLAIAFKVGGMESHILHDFTSENIESLDPAEAFWFDPRTQYLCPEGEFQK